MSRNISQNRCIISDLETDITDHLRRCEFAVFCGAGISLNSALPLASEIKKRVLKQLSLNTEDINRILESDVPFESFLGIVNQSASISPILEIFTHGEPNTTHLFLAKLVRCGCLKTITTTNFDLLIEKALAQQGLKEGKDFKKYFTENDFSTIDFKDIDNEISLFKIHGSIDDLASIRSTIGLVASRALSQHRAHVIKHIFSSGCHSKVMVMGYGCSDFFDVTPQIQSIDQPKRDILFVEHSQQNAIDCIETADDISLKGEKNAFKGFPGKRIICNTDRLVEELWKTLETVIGEYDIRNQILDWERLSDEQFFSLFPTFQTWTQELEQRPGLRKSLAGDMVQSISNFERAIDYHQEALAIFKETGNEDGEFWCNTQLGIAFGQLRDNRAIQFFKDSSASAFKTNNDGQKAAYYINIGNFYLLVQKPKKAKQFLNKAASIIQKMQDPSLDVRLAMGLGWANRQQGKYEEAVKWYDRAFETSKMIGDKTGEAVALMNAGVVFRKLSDSVDTQEMWGYSLDRAYERFQQALEIAVQIGDIYTQMNCCLNLGNVYKAFRKFERADESYRATLQIAQRIGAHTQELGCYRSLFLLYTERGLKRQADEFLQMEQKALQREHLRSGSRELMMPSFSLSPRRYWEHS